MLVYVAGCILKLHSVFDRHNSSGNMDRISKFCY